MVVVTVMVVAGLWGAVGDVDSAPLLGERKTSPLGGAFFALPLAPDHQKDGNLELLTPAKNESMFEYSLNAVDLETHPSDLILDGNTPWSQLMNGEGRAFRYTDQRCYILFWLAFALFVLSLHRMGHHPPPSRS